MLIRNIVLILCSSIVCLVGCRKLVDIPAPENQLTTSQTFADSATVNSVVAGMYSFMYNSNSSDGGPYKNYITTLSSLTADETYYFSGNTYPQFENNAIPVANEQNLRLWADSYTAIYMANNILENIQYLSKTSDAYRNQIIGEAKFMRAFCYFYLTNFYGSVPLILTTDVSKTATFPRTPQADVYAQIVSDLTSSQMLLNENYTTLGKRNRVNKYGAIAMLSRVYLYLKRYADAETAATLVIDHKTMYNLETLEKMFLQTSSESILQFSSNIYNATYVAMDFLPGLRSNIPNFVITKNLYEAFAPTDLRKANWIGTVNYGGVDYHFPNKYKRNDGGTTALEDDIVLRISEQYLIRAEARANLNDLIGAKEDVDIIRSRADVSKVQITTQTDMLELIAHERQVELFCEWGQRWLDLKRTNRANEVLSVLKPNWKSTSVLFPIPQQARSTNKNLSQNPGYN